MCFVGDIILVRYVNFRGIIFVKHVNFSNFIDAGCHFICQEWTVLQVAMVTPQGWRLPQIVPCVTRAGTVPTPASLPPTGHVWLATTVSWAPRPPTLTGRAGAICVLRVTTAPLAPPSPCPVIKVPTSPSSREQLTATVLTVSQDITVCTLAGPMSLICVWRATIVWEGPDTPTPRVCINNLLKQCCYCYTDLRSWDLIFCFSVCKIILIYFPPQTTQLETFVQRATIVLWEVTCPCPAPMPHLWTTLGLLSAMTARGATTALTETEQTHVLRASTAPGAPEPPIYHVPSVSVIHTKLQLLLYNFS